MIHRTLYSINEGDPLPLVRSKCCNAKIYLKNVKTDSREEEEDIVVGVEGESMCEKCGNNCKTVAYQMPI